MALTSRSTADVPRRARPTLRGPNLRSLGGDSLFRNSALVMATNLSGAFAGYLYWIVAARTNSPTAVGVATAAISTMNLGALVAGLGVSTGIIDRLARAEDEHQRNRIITAAAAITGAASLITGLALLALIPRVSPEVVPVLAAGGALLLIAGIATQVWGDTLDRVFVGERRAEGMLARNTLHGVAKLGFVALGGLAAWQGGRFLLGTWVAAQLLALVITLVILQPRLTRRWRPTFDGLGEETGRLIRPSLMHFLADVGGGIPIRVLPIIVVARVGADAGAYFYVTWMVGGVIYMASTAVSGNLFAEGSLHPDRLNHLTFRSARLIGLMVGLAVPGCLLLGRPVLSIFGGDYAAQGFPLLMVIVLSAIPDAVTNVMVARWRVSGRRVRVAVLNVVMTVIVVALAWAFTPRFGIIWVGWSWLIAQSAGAVGSMIVEWFDSRNAVAARDGVLA